MIQKISRHFLKLFTFLSVAMSHVISFGIVTESQKILQIQIIGDSITAGYGVKPDQSYTHVLESLIKRDLNDIKVITGGVSGATTAGALDTVRWFIKTSSSISKEHKVLILALGGNDFLRGLSPDNAHTNLSNAIREAKNHYALVILFGMRVPTNYGEKYRHDFEAIYPTLAKKYSIPLLPHLLDGVGGVARLNQPDGIHPNPEGHQKIAEHVYVFLKPLLLNRKVSRKGS